MRKYYFFSRKNYISPNQLVGVNYLKNLKTMMIPVIPPRALKITEERENKPAPQSAGI